MKVEKFFPKAFLENLINWGHEGDSMILEDEMVEHKRWSIKHYVVFRHEGRFWSCEYYAPATECQESDQSMFYADDVLCVEMEAKRVETIKYVVKADQIASGRK